MCCCNNEFILTLSWFIAKTYYLLLPIITYYVFHYYVLLTIMHDYYKLMRCPMQVRFDPSGLQYKTMKSMDRAARLAMMPDYEMYCVDLTEGD